ncbi:hypothetical protein N182_12225 [Sinorhizobium sp. GL2]|nr:hypothetical protein N182_12225 [Sinorhizobium sp. GL2]
MTVELNRIRFIIGFLPLVPSDLHQKESALTGRLAYLNPLGTSGGRGRIQSLRSSLKDS